MGRPYRDRGGRHAGGATTLEAADDTNNSSTDFVLGAPSPRNNANQDGVTPSSTCGDASVQGLEGSPATR